MLCGSTILALALSLFVAASPQPRKRSGGVVSIPFSGRSLSSLKQGDGTINRTEVIRRTKRTFAKHAHNQKNFKRNVQDKSTAINVTDLHRRQSVLQSDYPLMEIGDGEEWLGAVSIGTPSQDNFMIAFDTGSADFWLPSIFCTLPICSPKTKYNPNVSKTSSLQDGTFKIAYEDNSVVSGPVFRDTVNVGGITAVNQIFSPVDHISSSFADNPIDGIMGLGYTSISTLNDDPPLTAAWKQGRVQHHIFAMKLAENSSFLSIGGVDSDLFVGDFEYHSVFVSQGDSEPSLWQIGGASVSVGSSPVLSNMVTMIDSGSSLMYGRTEDVAKFYTSIPGSQLSDSVNGFYSIPCSSSPSVSFSWGGQNWMIPNEDFIVGPVGSDSSDCTGALIAQDGGLGPNTMLLGDSFMKNVYTAFDFERGAIGFAQLE